MTNRFDVLDNPIEGLAVIQRKPIGDTRGYLERIFCTTDLAGLFQGKPIRQINHTLTARKGSIRGMHFQIHPFSEIKLVTCVRGEVLDVAVDLRKDSPSFLHWHSEILSDSNHKSLFIPEGFAHGFQTLTSDCELLYLHTADYQVEAEGGLNALDPRLGIDWPLPVSDMSDRDRQHPDLNSDFEGII